MDRIPSQGYATAIEEAFRVIPARMHSLLNVHFLCGVDPVFAGLHRFIDVSDGRSYRNTAHCVHVHHQSNLYRSDRVTTIVLPTVPKPWVVVHELGHALHGSLDFDHDATPVTEYAKANRFEAFAEAFTANLYWNYGSQPDKAMVALFDGIGR